MSEAILRAVVVLTALSTTCHAATAVGSADRLQGARAVILAATSGATQEEEKASPEEAQRRGLYRELKNFTTNGVALPPREAAARWLDLLDRVLSLPGRQGYYSGHDGDPFLAPEDDVNTPSVTPQTALAALPSPKAWESLAALIKESPTSNPLQRRRAIVLRLLAKLLNGDTDELQSDFDALEETVSDSQPYQVESFRNKIGSLRVAFQKTAGFERPEDLVRDYRTTIETADVPEDQRRSIRVPDLVRLVGEKEAATLLRKTVLVPGLNPDVPSGGDTLALLKKVTLEQVPNLSRPRWRLVNSVEDVELFEAMDRKFPVKKKKTGAPKGSGLFLRQNRGSMYDRYKHERTSALAVYLLGLVHRGETTRAIDYALQADIETLRVYGLGRGMRHSQDEEFAGRLFEFLDAVLAKKPGLQWWDQYVTTAMMARQGEKARKRLTGAIGSDGLNTDVRLKLQGQLASLYLAEDNVEAGIKVFRKIAETDLSDESANVQQQVSHLTQQAMTQLGQLGRLLEKPELVSESVALQKAWIEKQKERSQGDSGYLYRDLINRLIKNERYAEAEELLADRLSDMVRQRRKTSAMDRSAGTMMNAQDELVMLAGLYDKTDRTDDVLYLLEEVPWWGVADLKDLGGEISTVAARALSKKQRTGEAVRLLRRSILQNPGDDDAYEVLVGIGGDDLVAWLDKVYSRDRFEERPLIWKAVIQLRMKKYEQAEQTIRQALKVDPTDGETEAGKRVRAYEILADILDARGKKDDAEFFRDVVRSVRTAEEGDQFTQAGLIKRSLELYLRAEQDFVDAYCVQWRLAERLHATGRYEEAEKHYAIAFKRMPEQFGRVASFCFGCQGVFNRSHSRSVAERVLTQLVKEQPDNPQVHFLLGQLRQAQDEHVGAYGHFRKAVALDPEYLDAWNKLFEVHRMLFLPKKEIDTIILEGLRLDPLQRHFSGGGFREMADLKALWGVLEKNREQAIDLPADVFPLKAARREMEKLRGGQDGQEMFGRSYGRRYGGYGRVNPVRPAVAILQHSVVSQLLQLFNEM
ncbi:MAG: tetratricopeptide repeat protein [Lentisphaerae bacterium]|nr:tetratricopeptide repeat protein [Lentisphaerota bacterium]